MSDEFDKLWAGYCRQERTATKQYSNEAEKEALTQMLDERDREKNPHIQEFMTKVITYSCYEGTMRLPYMQEVYWKKWIREERKSVKKYEPLKELYRNLEIVANNADSSGYTKVNSNNRYPLSIDRQEMFHERLRMTTPDISPTKLMSSYYQFGVHSYPIMRNIENMVRFLENRYSIDFKELEEKFRKSHSNSDR